MNMEWYKEGGVFDSRYIEDFLPIINDAITEQQVSFVINVLKLPPKSKILDLAGGHGRHSIKLAQRGYKCYLLDINENFLTKAKELANKKGVALEILKQDMRDIKFNNYFDAVISLATSFGYFSTDEDHFKVINSVFKALKREGLFLLDLDNRERTIRNFKKYEWFKIKDTFVLREAEINLRLSRLDEKIVRIYLNEKKIKEDFLSIRMFTLKEIREMLEKNKFEIKYIFGGYNFENYDIDSPRMIIIAKKS